MCDCFVDMPFKMILLKLKVDTKHRLLMLNSLHAMLINRCRTLPRTSAIYLHRTLLVRRPQIYGTDRPPSGGLKSESVACDGRKLLDEADIFIHFILSRTTTLAVTMSNAKILTSIWHKIH